MDANLQNSAVSTTIIPGRYTEAEPAEWQIESVAGRVVSRTFSRKWGKYDYTANPQPGIPPATAWTNAVGGSGDVSAYFTSLFATYGGRSEPDLLDRGQVLALPTQTQANASGYSVTRPPALTVPLPMTYDLEMTQRFTADYDRWEGSVSVLLNAAALGNQGAPERTIDSAGRMTAYSYDLGGFHETTTGGVSSGTFDFGPTALGFAMRTHIQTYAVDTATSEVLEKHPISRTQDTDYEGLLRDEKTWHESSLVDQTSHTYRANERDRVATYRNGQRISYTQRVSPVETLEHAEDGQITRTRTTISGEVIDTAKVGISGNWVTNMGLSPEPDVVTSTHELGLTTLSVTRAGSIVKTSSSTRDMAGRLVTSVDEDGLITSYLYSAGGRITTEILPNGGTRITENYLDGKLKSVSGTAVVHEFHDYEITPEGYEVHTTYLGTSTAPASARAAGTRWTATTTNGLGWLLKEERPSPAGGGAVISTEHFYNKKGQRYKTTRTGLADTLYVYDWFGELRAQGQDYNGNGQLDLQSHEPITVTQASYVKEDNTWYLVQSTSQYANESASQPSFVSRVVKQQLGGTSQFVTETGSDGSVTSTRTIVFPNTRFRKVSRFSSNGFGEVQDFVNGLLRAQSSSLQMNEHAVSHTVAPPDGLSLVEGTRFFYDPMERLVAVKPLDAPATRTVYDDGSSGGDILVRSRVKQTLTRPKNLHGDGDFVLDATYEYDAATGQLVTTNSRAGETVHYAYDLAGRLSARYGTGTQTLSYEYNLFGEQSALHTYRTTPAGPPPWAAADSDVTLWYYDSASGALTSKKDASNQSVSYTYHPAGQLHTRTWARGVVSTYLYTPEGRLESINHSDATPGVQHTYWRTGALKRTIDGAGTHEFSLPPVAAGSMTETHTAADLPGAVTVTATQDNLGRRTGWQMQAGGATLASVSMGYDFHGRLREVLDAADAQAPQGFRYAYESGSTRVSEISRRFGSGVASWRRWQGRTYDALNRSATIRYEQPGSGALVLGWQYGYDPLRPQRRTSTQALGGGLPGWAYGFNDRAEVTGASRSTDGTAAAAVPGQNWGYAYDGMGNRSVSTRGLPAETATGGMKTTYYSTNELNQYSEIQRPNALEVTGVTAGGVPTVKVNGQPPTGRPPSNGEPGGFAQWVDGLSTVSAPWMEFTLEVARSTGTSHMREPMLFVRPSEEPVYDLDGNLTSDAWGSYTWDADNRLTGATMHEPEGLPAKVALQRIEMIYDAQGRRSVKRVLVKEAVDAAGNVMPRETAWRLVKETRFWYDGWNLMVETQRRAGGTDWHLLRRYTWGSDLSGSLQGAGGVGGLLGVTVNLGAISGDASGPLQHYATLTEVNGNLMGLLEADTGKLVARWDYDPFGNPVTDWYAPGSSASAASCPIRFSSKYQDEETGWLYYGFRYYSSDLGRWTNRDPIGERGGPNIYAMTKNDLVNYWDYLGLWEIAIGKAIEQTFNDKAGVIPLNRPDHTANGVPTGQVMYPSGNPASDAYRRNPNGRPQNISPGRPFPARPGGHGWLLRVMAAFTDGPPDWNDDGKKAGPIPPPKNLVSANKRYCEPIYLLLVTRTQREGGLQRFLKQTLKVELNADTGKLKVTEERGNVWSRPSEGGENGQAGALASRLIDSLTHNSAGVGEGLYSVYYEGSGGWEQNLKGQGIVDHSGSGRHPPDPFQQMVDGVPQSPTDTHRNKDGSPIHVGVWLQSVK